MGLIAATTLALTLGLTGAATAQTASSGMAGVVKDESGGAVPGASLKVVSEPTGVVVEAFSTEQGTFDVPGLLVR